MPYIIAITGGSGAGKTTLSNYLKQKYPHLITQLPYDNYCVDRSNYTMEERAKINYDLPDSYDAPLFYKHIQDLKKGLSINQPLFDFPTHTRKKETIKVEPNQIVIIEGIMVLQVPNLKDIIDLTIYVDADDDLKLSRRIMRDTKERGRTVESVINQYLATVKPSFKKYIEPSKTEVDIVFDNNTNDGLNKKELKKVIEKIEEVIK